MNRVCSIEFLKNTAAIAALATVIASTAGAQDRYAAKNPDYDLSGFDVFPGLSRLNPEPVFTLKAWQAFTRMKYNTPVNKKKGMAERPPRLGSNPPHHLKPLVIRPAELSFAPDGSGFDFGHFVSPLGYGKGSRIASLIPEAKPSELRPTARFVEMRAPEIRNQGFMAAAAAEISSTTPGAILHDLAAELSTELAGGEAHPLVALPENVTREADGRAIIPETPQSEIAEFTNAEAAVETGAAAVDAVSSALAQAEAAIAAHPDILIVPPLETADVTATLFPSMREAAIDAAGRTDSSLNQKLHLARVLLGGGFGHEALDVLRDAQVSHPSMSPAEGLEISAMALAAGAMGAKVGTLADQARSASREGASFWPVMDLLVTTPDKVSVEDLRAATASLDSQSHAVAARFFPMLFDAALRVQDNHLAGELLVAGRRISGFGGSAMEAWMQGRLAQIRGDEETAFDRYVAASDVNDIHGARARLAIADMVLRRRDPSLLPDLRRILDVGVQNWRGDEVSLGMMVRLASVTETLADAPSALRVMSRIMTEYPGTREAELARERIPVVLRAYIASLDNGKTSMRDYLAALRDLEPDLHLFSDWIPAREALAADMARNGLHVAAAAEYRALRLSTRPDDPIIGKHATRETAAEISAGNLSAAAVAQAHASTTNDPGLETLRREYSVKFGTTRLTPGDIKEAGEGELREFANLSYSKGQHADAVLAWDQLISRGKSLSGQEIPNYLQASAYVAKNVSGDTIQRDALKGETETITMAAEALSQDMPDISRLSTQTASQMLADAGKAIEAAQGVRAGIAGRLAKTGASGGSGEQKD
ncbi:hypothetical protein ACEUZ9_004047 [Paracoccus litorisediminis]|uniref:hypothetical protein n=1 Tax=Paracoccus litorisediminis TaxID=2006130 RepID=UPI00373087F1